MPSCVTDINAHKHTSLVSMTTLHDKNPVVTRVEHLLDPKECNYMIRLANNVGCRRSTVVSADGNDKSSARTSSTCYIDKGKDEVVSCIEKKIATVAQQPHEDLEGLQVTKYVKNQEYKPHHDWFYNPEQQNTQRSATVCTYLKGLSSNCGGATLFPNLMGDDGSLLRSHPKSGDAIIWRNLTHLGNPEQNTLHAGEPVTCNEEKIGLNAWFGSKKYIHPKGNDDSLYLIITLLIVVLITFKLFI